MLIIVIAVSAAFVLYSTILILFTDTPKQRVKKRLNQLAENVELEYIHDAVLNEKKKRRKVKVKPKLVSRRFEDSLALSGIHISAQEYVALWVFLTLGPGLVGIMLNMDLVAVLGICVVGFAIPPIMVQRSRSKQQQLFNKQLGESLTIMSNCMRSGYSFQQAMHSISKEMQPPVSTEFGRVVREINYGATLEQALNNMSQRVNSKDFDLLISAVITSAQVGANLSEILDTISETITDRIRLREEVRVFSAQGRMSGIIIGLLPVFVILFLMILNPTYLTDFVNHPIGKLLLIASVFLEVIGFILINRIVDIKY
ncbi:MAG: type II secretion system F family protein [Clostridia bacterium]|nr:type II secretion system F family protein [Clostridia bacterium]MBR6573801.1 type II secretion system F family protein [Clostridia bacterium]